MPKLPTWAWVTIAALLGAAYASKVKSLPVVGSVLNKLPGSDA